MRIVDSRRMTGSNLYTRESGAVIDLAFDPDDDREAIVARWAANLARVWPDGLQHVRHYRGGVALFVEGPLDVLMPLTDLNEWALGGDEPFEPLLAAIEEARVPRLAELIVAARAHRVALLVDDDTITLGTGRDQLRYERRGQLPAASAVDWETLGRIPIGIVTGTNGKTTTTRLVARMIKCAGLVPGITSSDGVAVDEQFVARGDFSGPEGTRMVLRRPEVEVAVLETARGGILRRGLPVEQCDAALITNVSADHLGDYGVDDVQTMARVKAVVGRDARIVILNAEDPELVPIARDLDTVEWFSRTDKLAARWRVRDGQIMRDGIPLVAVADIPITFAGRAVYNIDNALAAAALASALGIEDEAIVAGLRSFTSSIADNPGRGNVSVLATGVTALVDFGHNPVAIRAVLAFARTLGTGALRVTIGMPGDRLDDDLRALAKAIADDMPAQVVVRELSSYLLRGRAPGEIPAVIAQGLRDAGVANVALATDELDAVKQLLAAAAPDDIVVVLTHLDPAVDDLIAAMIAQ